MTNGRSVLDDYFMICDDCYMVAYNGSLWQTPKGVSNEKVQLRTQEINDAIKALPGKMVQGNFQRDVFAGQVPPCDCCHGESLNMDVVGVRYHFILVERDDKDKNL